MRIRYYCPDCQKKSILNAIYTAEPRVCAWCGFPIYSKHVQEQNEAKQPFGGFGLNICVWPCWAALLLAFPNRGDNELRNLLWALDLIAFFFFLLTAYFVFVMAFIDGSRNDAIYWMLRRQREEIATNLTPDNK